MASRVGCRRSLERCLGDACANEISAGRNSPRRPIFFGPKPALNGFQVFYSTDCVLVRQPATAWHAGWGISKKIHSQRRLIHAGACLVCTRSPAIQTNCKQLRQRPNS